MRLGRLVATCLEAAIGLALFLAIAASAATGRLYVTTIRRLMAFFVAVVLAAPVLSSFGDAAA